MTEHRVPRYSTPAPPPCEHTNTTVHDTMGTDVETCTDCGAWNVGSRANGWHPAAPTPAGPASEPATTLRPTYHCTSCDRDHGGDIVPDALPCKEYGDQPPHRLGECVFSRGARYPATASPKAGSGLREALRDARDALDRDRTGLAAALNKIRGEITGRYWLRPEGGWANYSWEEHTAETLRKEIGWAFDAVLKIAAEALAASGALANAAVPAADAALASHPEATPDEVARLREQKDGIDVSPLTHRVPDMRACAQCGDLACFHDRDGCHANDSAAGCLKKCRAFIPPPSSAPAPSTAPTAESAPRPPGYGSPDDACADLEGYASRAAPAAPEVDPETKCAKHGALVCEECAREEAWLKGRDAAADYCDHVARQSDGSGAQEAIAEMFRSAASRIRALTPSVPGAADEEG